MRLSGFWLLLLPLCKTRSMLKQIKNQYCKYITYTAIFYLVSCLEIEKSQELKKKKRAFTFYFFIFIYTLYITREKMVTDTKPLFGKKDKKFVTYQFFSLATLSFGCHKI